MVVYFSVPSLKCQKKFTNQLNSGQCICFISLVVEKWVHESWIQIFYWYPLTILKSKNNLKTVKYGCLFLSAIFEVPKKFTNQLNSGQCIYFMSLDIEKRVRQSSIELFYWYLLTILKSKINLKIIKYGCLFLSAIFEVP